MDPEGYGAKRAQALSWALRRVWRGQGLASLSVSLGAFSTGFALFVQKYSTLPKEETVASVPTGSEPQCLQTILLELHFLPFRSQSKEVRSAEEKQRTESSVWQW